MGHKKLPEEAIVQPDMAMNMDEVGMQEAYNNTQDLMTTPNSKEVIASDATATQDTTMQQLKEQQQEEEDMEVDDDDDDEEEEEEEHEEEEEEGFNFFVTANNEQNMELLVPGVHAMQWIFLFGREVDGNTAATAVAPHATEVGQDGLRFFNPMEAMDEDENYMDYVANMLPVQTGSNIARAFPLETRIQETLMVQPNAMAIDHVLVKSTSQSVFNSFGSKVVFAGMEEGTDNDWYDSIAHDAQMMEEMEDPGIEGIASPLQLPRSEAPKEEPSAEEASPDLSLEDISKMWGLHPSELDPDEPGPSTRAQSRVAPLADNEVAKFDCGICLETLPIFDLFHGMSCPHKFCVVCMDKYIKGRTRVGEVPIPCPDPSCKEEGNDGILNPEDCKKSIDFDVFCAWTNLLTENAIPPNQRVYCPNRECRIMLEMVDSTFANKTPSKVPCPACNNLMCTSCRMDWTSDGSGQHDCTEGPEAKLVKQLADQRRWKQCPRCKYYVERTTGCDVMTCRCRAVFCYTCGRLMLQALDEGGEMCRCGNQN